MKKIFLVAIILSFATLASCSVSSQLMSNRNVTQTNVELSQKNFNVIGEAQGTYVSTYILGVGGLSKKALAENARAAMLKNANLKGSQAVINTSVEIKRYGFLPFCWKYKVTSSAQIIEFIE